MAVASFAGSSDGLNLTSTRNIPLSGSGGYGITTSVTAYGRFSTTSASKITGQTIYVTVYSGGRSYSGQLYISGSSDWGNEYSGHTFSFPIAIDAYFDSQSVTSMDVSISGNGSYIFTKGAFSVSVTYTVPTANNPPTSCSVASTSVNPGASVNLNFSGASAGVAGSISAYEVQYAEAASSGASYGAWTNLSSSVSSSPYIVKASSTHGAVRKFRVRALSSLGSSYHSAWKESTNTITTKFPTKLSAPATASFASATANPGVSVNFNWGAVSDANLNALSGYEVQTRTSTDGGSTWSSWGNTTAIAKGTTTLAIAAGGGYGNIVQAHVRAKGAAGSSYYSDYKTCTNNLTTNYPTKLANPGSVTLSATTANPGVNVNVTWAAVASQNLNTISDYEVQYAESTDGGTTWANWVSLGTTTSRSIALAAGGTSGYRRKARVRARGSAGSSYYSSWVETNNVVASNYPTKLVAPTTALFASTTANPGVDIKFNYAASANKNLNSVTKYEFQYATSTNGGSTWSAWKAAGSENAGVLSHDIAADNTWGVIKKVRVRAQGSAGADYYSDWKEGTNQLTTNFPEKLATVASFSVSATVADPGAELTLNWVGATAANLNGIQSYDIDYRDSSNGGTTWGLWYDLTTVSSTQTSGSRNITAPTSYGVTRQFRIRVLGAAGEEYYSDFKNSSNTITSRTPTKATAPNKITLDATTTNPGVATTLRWEGAAGGTINAITKIVIQQSDSSDLEAWSSWTSAGEVSGTGATGSHSVTSPTTNGRYRKFRIQVQGAAGSSYYSDWAESTVMLQATPITVVGAPTNAYVTPTNTESNAQLFFSGAKDGVYNTITGFGWQYADSADGVNYGSWSAEATANIAATSGDFTVTPPSERGHYRKFRIRTRGSAGSSYYSPWYELTTTLRKNTHPTQPTTLTFTPNPFEDTVKMSWGGHSGGVGNAISSFTLAWSTSDNGTSFSAETVVPNIETAYYNLNTADLPRAKYVRFRVLAVGEGGLSSGYSNYSSPIGRKNSVPAPPTDVLPPAVFDPSNTTFEVFFTSGEDIDNNIKGYEVALKYPDGTFFGAPSIVATSTGGLANSIVVNGSTFARGASWLIAVRAYDTLGIRSEWATSTALMAVNPLPAVPSIIFPTSGKTTYNPRPRVGVRLTGGVQGKGHSVRLTFNGVERSSVGSYESEFSKVGNTLKTGDAFVWRLNEPLGATTVIAKNFLTNDGIADLPVANRPSQFNVSVAVFTVTDPVLTVNLTQVKAAHINELRSALNTVEGYYGMTATTWDETITKDSTNIKASHIYELRSAVDRIITYVNQFDPDNAVNNIDPITWTDSTLLGTTIKAVHVQEIRDAIVTL